MFRIHSRFDAISLCTWRECTGCPEPAFVRNREATNRWLSTFLSDDVGQGRLREMAHATGDGLGLATLKPHQILDHLTDCIATGRLRVCGKGGVVPHEAPMELTTGMAPPGPPPEPVARSSSAPAAAPPEPPTLPPVDGEAMAAVLVAAADDGVPFCEICEKNKQARQATAAMA